jgi:hypothetical protein
VEGGNKGTQGPTHEREYKVFWVLFSGRRNHNIENKNGSDFFICENKLQDNKKILNLIKYDNFHN